MLMINHVSGCCGVRELTNLRSEPNPASAIRSMGHIYEDVRDEYGGSRMGDRRWRFAFFSQANGGLNSIRATDIVDAKTGRLVYGEAFAAYIRDNNLGNVVETDEKVNPNSHNLLKVWMWTVDHDILRAHIAKLKKELINGTRSSSTPSPTV